MMNLKKTLLVIGLLSGCSLVYSLPARADLTCSEGMRDGSTYYKATSLGGITMSNVNVSYEGDGWYAVSMNITANQGLKKWYSSTSRNEWIQVASRSDAAVGQLIKDCSSGLVVAAQQTTNVNIGTGTGTMRISQGYMGGTKGNSFVLYDERNDGFINISSIRVNADYAGGVSKEDDSVSRKVDFRAYFYNFNNVPDGNYTVYVDIPIGASSTWFPNGNGYNYWWATALTQIPTNFYIRIPVQIRSENQKPVDPVASCQAPSSVILDHHTMSPGQVNGAYTVSKLSVYCSGAMSGSFELKGDTNSGNESTQVSLGKGVTSTLKGSVDGKNWYRKQTSLPFKSGTNTIQISSTLSTQGIPTEGNLTGSAVLIVNYN